MKPEYDVDDSPLKYSKADIAYMQSLSAAVVERSPKHLMLIVFIITSVIFFALIWMSWAEIDVVVRGNGKVIPARQLQLIQSLEGGIVAEILVKEGDIVNRSQPLIKISDVAFSSSFEENRLLYFELSAKSARLKAESGNGEFERDIKIATAAPEIMKSEESLFESNRQQLHQTLSIYDEQVSQQQSTLEEAQSKQRQLTKSLDLLKQEVKIKKPLVERRILSEVEYLQLQQREAEVEGELDGVRLSIRRLRSAVEEGRRKREQVGLDFSNKAKRELNEVVSEISRIEESQTILRIV